MLLASATTFAQAEPSKAETNVRAAILFNLVRFSYWQDDNPTFKDVDETDFVFCTCADTDFNLALKSMSGKPVHDRTMVVKVLDPKDTQTDGCQVLYFSGESRIGRKNLSKLTEAGVLTVGDNSSALRGGSAMVIKRQETKLRFFINEDVVKDAGIKPSSKILALAADR